MGQQTGSGKEVYQNFGLNIGGYLSTVNTNTISTKIGSMQFTASSVKEVIGLFSGGTGLTQTEISISSKLNEMLNTINYVNSDVKRQKYQSLHFKGFNTIVRDIQAILSISSTDNRKSETKIDSNKVADETALKAISSSSLVDGEIRYVEDKKQFYSFDKDDDTGTAPDDKGTSGAPGTWNAIGISKVENKTFTLAANGLSATGGVLTNPGANPTLTITTTKKLKLWQGLIFQTSDNTIYSQGLSDGTIQNCIGGAVGGLAQNSSSTTCINISNPGDGWTGTISAINNSSFDITFTQVGSGLAITGQMHLIE